MTSASQPLPESVPGASTIATVGDEEHAQGELAAFEGILNSPTPHQMYGAMFDLSWEQFERFVRYVFECAGYTVDYVGSDHKRYHVDLRLYDGPTTKGRPTALVEIRHYKSALLKHQAVAAFVGNLTLAGAKRGYLITTGTFTGPAMHAAQQATQRGIEICLTDWKHLARYLTYLRGSRITGLDGRKRTPRPTPPDCLQQADLTPRRDPTQTTVLAIANNRGGVAKTTSALNLALALVAKGKRVLLLDLDGQANLTLALPAPPPRRDEAPTPERTIVEFFAGRATLAELARPTRRERLWIIPGHGELYTRDRGGGADPEAELAFVRALHTLQISTSIEGAGLFDWIIMDTPPAQSCYTRAALAAAHVIILPTIVEPFAARSINRLVETADTMRGLMGRDGHILGIFGVRWPTRPSLQLRSDLGRLKAGQETHSISLLDILVPEDGRIATANQRMIEGGISGIFAYRRSAAARAYRDLLTELEGKVQP